jgi:chitinase
MTAPRFSHRSTRGGVFGLAAATIGALAFLGLGSGSALATAPQKNGHGNPEALRNGAPVPALTTNPSIFAPADLIVGEGDGHVALTVRLSDQSSNTVTVQYATADSTAFGSNACNFDYTGVSGTLTFNPGETSKTVQVQILDCPNVTGFKAFTFNLSSATNGVIDRAGTRVGIVDNDTVVATPKIFARDAIVDEKDGVALVSVVLGGTGGQASNSTVTVDYATADGTAAAGSDYTAVSGTLDFAPGATAKTVAIPITDDATAEGRERFSLVLSNPSNGAIATGTGTVTIGASDTTTSTNPSILAPPDLIVGEADGFVDLPVTLSAPSPNPVSVGYTTADSTAFGSNACNFDYTGVSGTLTIAPGETTKVVRVQILDCPNVARFKAFTLNLSSAVNGVIARAGSRIGIVDNDTIVATPRVFVRDATVDEKDGFARVSVLLGGTGGQSSNSTVAVDYATADGTAAAGSDYTAVSGTLDFAPGETAKTVFVPISDDALAEGQESLVLNLTNPTNATISDGSGSVLIGASDNPASSQPAVLAPPDTIVSEGDGYVDLPVRLSQPGTDTATVHYATANSTAFASNACNFDYTGVSGDLTFAPGETTKVVRVQILDCPNVALFKAFTFDLSGATNSAISRASSRISTVDNDTVVATPRLFVRNAVVDEKDGTALVSVLLGNTGGQASNSSVTVDYSTGDGTASAGSDYTATNGALTFAPGETAKTVPISITDDGATEGQESFTLALSNPANAAIATGTATVTIGAGDGGTSTQPRISAPADVTVGESDGFVDIAVQLSAPDGDPVTIHYATANSTAFASNACNFDYTGVSGDLTFAPGETTKVVRVQILDCPNAALFKAFTFNLSSAVGGTITRASSRISIVDNDTVLPTPALTIRDAVVDEKDGFALVSVLLGNTGGRASNSTVTVDYTTANGSATGGSDYTAVAGTLNFAPGETAKTIVVPIADDAAIESAESFSLNLGNPTNATISDGTGTVTIGANDSPAVAQPGIFAPADVAVGEGDGFVDLVVRLPAPGQNPISVDYTTENVTAFASTACNFDYVTAAGTLNFAPGETAKVVRVQILDCPDVEPAETFNFVLLGAVGGAIADATTVVTIGDNDGPVTLNSIEVTPANPSIGIGADQQFTATGTYSDAHTEDLTSAVNWDSSSNSVATIAAGGLAHAVSAGASTISAGSGGITGSTVLTVSGLLGQTITFGALSGKTYGDPDFTVAASASSGLPVSFTATGNCTVSGATVHITGAGTCTITASQAGNGTYDAATPVGRSFSIAKAGQTITFTALPNKQTGAPDFAVTASASSGLPVAFAAAGTCTISGATVHLSGAGSCTITASQAGNANWNPAVAVAQTFTITAQPSPPPPLHKCKVPNVLGKTLGKAKSMLRQAHCRVGTVAHAYSRLKKKGIVIGQSRRPRRVFPNGTKVGLTVSRGRRRH